MHLSEVSSGIQEVRLAGLSIQRLTEDQAVSLLIQSATQGAGLKFSYAHGATLSLAQRSPEFVNVFNSFPYRFCDGIAVSLLSQFKLGIRLQKVTANSFFDKLMSQVSESAIRLGFVGGEPGVCEEVARMSVARYPQIQICLTAHGYLDEQELLNCIRESSADLILLGMGQPRQEFLASKLCQEISGTTVFCVGGLFDYVSGSAYSCPQWVRMSGMEWTLRLLSDPRKLWRRYLKDIPMAMLKEVFGTTRISEPTEASLYEEVGNALSHNHRARL